MKSEEEQGPQFVCIVMCSKWLQVNISHFAKNHFETILWRQLQYKLFGRERVTVYYTAVLDVRYTVVSDVYWEAVLNVYELQRQIFLAVGKAIGFLIFFLTWKLLFCCNPLTCVVILIIVRSG